MSQFCYLDIHLSLKEEIEEILPVYIVGVIENNLRQIFGEIGGCTTLELLNFNKNRFVLKVPSKDEPKVRVALILLSKFQGVSSYFKVIHSSNTPIQALTT